MPVILYEGTRFMKEYALRVLTISGAMILPGILTLAVLWIVERLSRPAVPEPHIIKPVSLPSPKKKMTASSILLLIGTAFIVFASIAFVAANWNNMEPAGKVFTLLAASAIAFAISAVMNAALRLKRTSIAFYAMGMLITAVAFVTAGYYELFGDWFSVGGDGSMLLYGAAALIVAAASFAGYTLYKSPAMHYIAFSFIALAISMISGQLADGYAMFSVIIITVQMIVTAVTELLSPGMKKSWGKPLKITSRAAACVYGALAVIHVVYSFFEADVYTYAVLAVILVQLIFYGIIRKSRVLIIAADVLAFYAALIVSIHVELSYKTSFAEIVFAGITLLIYIINRVIPGTGTAERITALSAAALGALVSLGAYNAPLALQIAAPLLVAAAIAELAFNKNIIIQYVAGILSPFMPFLVTINICDHITGNYNDSVNMASVVMALAYCGYALICMAAASAALFMRKICFPFHAKHPLKTQAFIYANLTAAGLAMLLNSGCTEISVVILVLCAVHFALSCMPGTNFTAITSSAAAIITIVEVIGDLMPKGYEDLEGCIYAAVMAVVLIASRFVFPDRIINVRENRRITADVLLMTAWLPLCEIRASWDYFGFLIMLSLAVYSAASIKRRTVREVSSCILTGSAALAAFALLERPFLISGSDTVITKINLVIFMLFGIACKVIWRNMKLVSKLLSTTIFVGCFASMIFDGIANDGILNRIFVLCVTALVLVLSFMGKSKTWFIASSVSLVVLTGFFMHEYIASAGWWLYLLVVGIILVTVAAVNEACRKKGENVISTVERKLSGWTW